jgi:hypothetical protein
LKDNLEEGGRGTKLRTKELLCACGKRPQCRAGAQAPKIWQFGALCNEHGKIERNDEWGGVCFDNIPMKPVASASAAGLLISTRQL